MQNLRLKDLEPEYRPDEKFMKYGPKALSDAELLAIILRTGSREEHSVELARRILTNNCGSNIINIYNYDIAELYKIKGIGKVKAIQIMAVAELSLRISQQSIHTYLTFKDPDVIAEYYMEQLRHKKREVVILLLLDSACNLLKECEISSGTVNASIVSPREVLIEALRSDAVNFIILHNHPSGLPTPSAADEQLTKALYDAGKLVGISLLDHIIIGDRKYISFRKEGLINE